jgi:hypothetical protein
MKALLAMLRRRAQVTWLGWACCGLALIAIPVTNYLTVGQMMKPMRFVVMDSRSTFYLSSAGSFESEKEIHCELAEMAAETIFDRSPDGFDAPQRLERLFNPASAAQLHSDAARDDAVFRVQQIHSKFEAGTIRELSVNNTTVLVSVKGQVLRSGIFNDKIVNQTRKVTVFLKLQVNDSMALNGRYPLVVTDYQERFE